MKSVRSSIVPWVIRHIEKFDRPIPRSRRPTRDGASPAQAAGAGSDLRAGMTRIEGGRGRSAPRQHVVQTRNRSEEHTSELQSQFHLVCRLRLEKKKLYTTHS